MTEKLKCLASRYNEKLEMTNQKMLLGVVNVSRDSILCKLSKLRAEGALKLVTNVQFLQNCSKSQTTQN